MSRRTLAVPPCGCIATDPTNSQRRRVIRIAAVGLGAPLAMHAWATVALAPGDRLVEEDAEGPPTPLRVADLKPGKPMLAYPLDAKRGKPRDETRLNKLVLIRLPEAEMAPATRARAAGGVLAYSAICTHQACDVKTWLAKEKALVCFCHASKFAVLDNATAVTGPATRALPSVALALDGDQLVIASGFSATPGAAPT